MQNRQKLQTGNSIAQFSSNLRQNLSPLLHPTVFKGLPRNSNSPFPLLNPPPPRLPPTANPPTALSPPSSTSICSTSMCTAATPSATGSAASCSPAGLSTDVSSHANSWRCCHDQLRHLLCHLMCRGALQELARARVEQVVLEPRCVQPSDHS